ncbi:MAG: CotH kinase family protein [Calditrichaeota bacterium]|nr:CotH kinase family protein [Calditrichota bacterium]
MIKKTVLKFLLLGFSIAFAQNPGDNVFNSPQVFEIHLAFEQKHFLDSLYHSQEIKEYIIGHISINNQDFDSVGVRFKGVSSFWGYPGDKKALRIKFDKFKEQRFDGLNRINLNNGWSDPTLLREKLYLDFLNEHGIPAPRANFAKVYINEKYWGMYTLTEHIDKTFLQQRFANNDGNLFKAERLATLEWKGSAQEDYYENYHLQTNESENDWSDLIQFINIINNSSPQVFQNALRQVLDTDGYLKVWAANNLFMNLDSYLGSANNFYLYNDEEQNRFRWIIWDVNLTFGARTGNDTLDIFWNPDKRPLINKLLHNDILKKEYLNSFKLLSADFNTEYFYPRIDALFDLIKADYFADTLKMYSNEEALLNIDEQIGLVPGLKSFIAGRMESVNRQIDVTAVPRDRRAIRGYSFIETYPNPFNSNSTITFSIKQPGKIKLTIYDINGRKVAELLNEFKQAGEYKINFNAKDLSSGFYFVRLQSSHEVILNKMILLK